MKLVIIAAAAAIVSCAALPAQAQQGPLTCADFQRNANGSWSPVHPVQIGGVTLGPGVAFGEGAIFAGVPLAKILNERCV